MKQRNRLTTKEVGASRTSFGWGTVSEVRKALGVFVSHWSARQASGCFLRHFARNQGTLAEERNDQLYVKLDVDKKDRIWFYQLFRKIFRKWLDLLMTICKTKLCERLSTV